MTYHPQLGLPLDSTPAYAREDFAVSSCNRAAYDHLQRWPEWPSPVWSLHGPEASGKSHLAHIWAAKAHAIFISPHAITDTHVAEWLAKKALSGRFVLDGMEHMGDETALFHFLNGLREQGGQALLVSRQPLSRLEINLPDLRSRMNAIPGIGLDAPDDEVLRAVLVKQFADRQLRVGEEVLHYLQARMDRSFAAAREWVVRIDNAALAEQRKVTTALVRELIEKQKD